MKRPTSRRNDTDSSADALRRLSEELTVLRQVLDDIPCEVQWANRSRASDTSKPLPFCRITSMPANVAASDWPARVKRFLPEDVFDTLPRGSGTTEGTLF